MELSNKKFQLVENNEGLASEQTLMAFDSFDSPYRAIYHGSNIEFGHVVVSSENGALNMLYHSLSKEGELSAGKAIVTLTTVASGGTEMQLNWQWLTGDLSSGISKWREVNA